MKQYMRSVVPELGRCIVFATRSMRIRAHPEPMARPQNHLRRSIALYRTAISDDARR
jgi:hypothetical protein